MHSWVFAIRLWIGDGPKLPMIFIGLWIVALFVLPLLGLGALFLVFEVILTVIMIMIERYKNAM